MDFFAGFQRNMLENSININNFNWNPIVLKKKTLLKPLKITIFWPNLHKNVSPWATPKTENNFFAGIIKHHISFQKLLSKYHMFWLSYEYFSLLRDVFLLKSVIFSQNCTVCVWNEICILGLKKLETENWYLAKDQGALFINKKVMRLISIAKTSCLVPFLFSTAIIFFG